MNLFVQTENGELDKEWFLLIQTAQKMGISIEEVRFYLAACKAEENNCHQEAMENSDQILTNA
jgi:DNA-binding transcriptional MerR regulator